MSPAAGSETDDDAQNNIEASKNGTAALILMMLDHYKQKDPVGIPGAPVEDPMLAPDMAKSIGMANLNMKNVKAYGMSKFRVDNIDVDFKEMKASAGANLTCISLIIPDISCRLMQASNWISFWSRVTTC